MFDIGEVLLKCKLYRYFSKVHAVCSKKNTSNHAYRNIGWLHSDDKNREQEGYHGGFVFIPTEQHHLATRGN